MKDSDWRFLRERIIPSIRNDRDRAVIERAAEVYARFERNGELSEPLFEALAASVWSASKTVRASGAGWIWELSRGRADVARRLVEWFDAGTAPVRLSLVQAIAFGWNKAEQVELEGVVIARGLRDRSAKVRVFAADRAETRGRRDLLPLLEAALAAEQNAKVRESLTYSRDLLRDGFRRAVKWDVATSYSIMVRYRAATHQGTVCVQVPRDVADAVGFPEVARRIRIREERPGARDGELWEPVDGVQLAPGFHQ